MSDLRLTGRFSGRVRLAQRWGIQLALVILAITLSASFSFAQGKGKGGNGGGGGGGGGGGDVSDPTGLTIVGRTTSSISLSWSSAGGATAGFIVAYDKDAVPRKKGRGSAQIDVGNVEQFTLDGLDYDSFYGIRVCAYDASGDVSNGAVISEFTLPMVSMDVVDDVGGKADLLSFDIQSDGKYVVSARGINDEPILMRYNEDGTRDTSFSGDGLITGAGLFGNFKSIELSTGKIVAITGHEPIGNELGAIAIRYHLGGSYDTETVMIAGEYDRVATRDLVELPNGQVLVLCHVKVNDFFSVRLIRLNADMSVDTTFGDNGVVSHVYPDSTQVHRFVLQADGYVVAAGEAGGFAFVARYDVLDGSEDKSHVFSNLNHILFDVDIDSQGNVYAGGGEFEISGDPVTRVIRLDPDGNLDTTWADNGVLTLNVAPSVYESGRHLAVDSQDRLYIGNNNSSGLSRDIQVYRLNPDGTLDTDWADNGVFIYDSGSNVRDTTWGIKIDDLDRAVIVGSVGAEEHALMLRLNQ